MIAKKALELHYLQMARDGVDDFPSGPITAIEETAEPPDFHVGESDLGIEVTRIFNENNTQSPQWDAERDLIVRRAEALANERGIGPLLVDVYFDLDRAIGSRERNSTAEQLVSIVGDHIPPIEGQVSVENSHKLAAIFPHQVQAISIRRFKRLTSHCWQTGDAGLVNDFAPAIQQIIQTKQARLHLYRDRFLQSWLIIVADWSGPSAFFEVSEKMASESYVTDFDRVYFVEGHSKRVFKLQTVCATS